MPCSFLLLLSRTQVFRTDDSGMYMHRPILEAAVFAK